jgi:hypothetical protein
MRKVFINLYNVSELKEQFPSSFSRAQNEWALSQVEGDWWSDPVINLLISEFKILGFDIDKEKLEWDIFRHRFIINGVWEVPSHLTNDKNEMPEWVFLKTRVNSFIQLFPEFLKFELYSESTLTEEVAVLYDIIKSIEKYAIQLLTTVYYNSQREDRFLEFCEMNKSEFTIDGVLFVGEEEPVVDSNKNELDLRNSVYTAGSWSREGDF